MQGVSWLPDKDFQFPHPSEALHFPSGLLALGGNVKPKTLLEAYCNGIFPWYEEEVIQWWSPDPRTVLFTDSIHISRSLHRRIRRRQYQVTLDCNFAEVMKLCAFSRATTWITPELFDSFLKLHQLGYAHSVEVRESGKLVGGLYGLAIGHYFCGESMFSLSPDSSKTALVYLCRLLRAWDFELIDCQTPSRHLSSLGACELARPEFLYRLKRGTARYRPLGRWELDSSLFQEW